MNKFFALLTVTFALSFTANSQIFKTTLANSTPFDKVICVGSISQLTTVVDISASGAEDVRARNVNVDLEGTVDNTCVLNVIIKIDGVQVGSTLSHLPNVTDINYLIPAGTTKHLEFFVDVISGISKNFRLKVTSVSGIGASSATANTEANAIIGNTMSIVDCPTGINQSKKISTFQIYPNPVKDKLIVETQSKDKIYIINSVGQNVWYGFEHQIDVSNLNPGVYFIKNESTFQKFVKE